MASRNFKSTERQIYIKAKDLMVRIDDTFTTWQPIRETNHQIIGSILKEAIAKEKKKLDKEKKKRKEVTEVEDEVDTKPAKSHCSLWHGLSSTTTMVCTMALSKDTEKNLESMILAVNKRDTETDKLVSICGFWNNIMENDRKYVESLRFQIQEYKDVVERYKELGDRIIAAQDIITMEENQEFKTLCNRLTILGDVVLGHVPVPSSDDLEKEISGKIVNGTLMDDLTTVISQFDKFKKSLLIPTKEHLTDIVHDMKNLLGNLRTVISKMRKMPGEEDQADSEELLNNLEEEIIEWYVQRKRASEELQTIIKQLNKHQAKTHKARTSGKITLTIGYVLDVIGGILIPVTFGGSIGLMAVGVSLSVAGHGTDSAALAIHKKMTKQLCEAALEIIKADEEKVNHITELLDDYKACIKAAKGVHYVSDVRQSLAENSDEDLSNLKIIPILNQMETKSPEEAAINLASQMAKTIATPSLERNLDELIEFVRTKGPSLLAQEFGLAQGKLYVPSSFEIGIIVHAIITSLESITQKTNEDHHADADSVFSDNVVMEGSDNKTFPLSQQSSLDSGLNILCSVTSDVSDTSATNASVRKARPVPKPRKSKGKTQHESQGNTEEKHETDKETPTRPVPAKRKPKVQPRETITKQLEAQDSQEESVQSDESISKLKYEIESIISSIDCTDEQSGQQQNKQLSHRNETDLSNIENMKTDNLSKDESEPFRTDMFQKENLTEKDIIETEIEVLSHNENDNTKCTKKPNGDARNIVSMENRLLPLNKPFGIAGGGIDVSYMAMYEKTVSTSPTTRCMRLSDCFDDEDAQSTISGQILPESSKYEDIRARAKPSERLNRLKDLMKGLKGKLSDSADTVKDKSHQRKSSNISYVREIGVEKILKENDESGSLGEESEVRNSKRKSKFHIKVFKKISSSNSIKDSAEEENIDQLNINETQKPAELSEKEQKKRKFNVKNIVQSIPMINREKNEDIIQECDTNTRMQDSKNTKHKEGFAKLFGKVKHGLASRFGNSRDDLDDIEPADIDIQPVLQKENDKEVSEDQIHKRCDEINDDIIEKDINRHDITPCKQINVDDNKNENKNEPTLLLSNVSDFQNLDENKSALELNREVMQKESNAEKMKHVFHGLTEKISHIRKTKPKEETPDEMAGEYKSKSKGVKGHLNLKGLRNKFKRGSDEDLKVPQGHDSPVSGSSLSIDDIQPGNQDKKGSKHFFKGISSKFSKDKEADTMSVSSIESSENRTDNVSKGEKLKKHKSMFKSISNNFKGPKDLDHSNDSLNDSIDEETKGMQIKSFVKGLSSRFHKKKTDSEAAEEEAVTTSTVSPSIPPSIPLSSPPSSPQSPISSNQLIPPDKPPRQYLYHNNEFAYLNSVIPPIRHPKKQTVSPPISPQATSSPEPSPTAVSGISNEEQQDTTRPKSVVLSCQWPKEPVSDMKTLEENVYLEKESDDLKDVSLEKKKEGFGTKLARLSLRKKKKTKEEKKKQTEPLL